MEKRYKLVMQILIVILLFCALAFTVLLTIPETHALSYTDQVTSWTLATNDSHSFYDHYESNWIWESTNRIVIQMPSSWKTNDYTVRVEVGYHPYGGTPSLVAYYDYFCALNSNGWIIYDVTQWTSNYFRIIVMKNGNVPSVSSDWSTGGMAVTSVFLYDSILEQSLGWQDGFDIGYGQGEIVGYNDGYIVGQTNEVVPQTLFNSVIGFVAGIFTIQILPGMTISGIIGIVIGFFFLKWFLRQIRG